MLLLRAHGRLDDVSSLAAGDHVCWTFASDEEHEAVLTAYYLAGLRAGEKLVYFADAYPPETVAGYLEKAGARVADLVDAGAVVAVPARTAYLTDGTFDADAMIGAFRAQSELAVSQGFKGLRAAGEMSWMVPELLDGDALVEYEHRCDRFTSTAALVGLCGYDARRSDTATIRALETVHAARIRSRGADVPFCVYAIGPEEVALDGEVDFASERELRVALAAAVRSAEADEVAVDVGNLEFIDVSGVRALADVARSLDERRAVVVRGASASFRSLAGRLGLEDWVPSLRVV